MQSIRTLDKVGKGPSSSHTMGPERAAKLFREMTPEADRYEVILYGSLAKTGVGHGTDRVLVDTLAPYPATSLSRAKRSMQMPRFIPKIPLPRSRASVSGGTYRCRNTSN